MSTLARLFAVLATCIAFAAEAQLTAEEKKELAAAARDFEQTCLKNTGAEKPITGTDYVSRVGLLFRELQPPQRFCACAAEGLRNLPPKLGRGEDRAALNEYLTNSANACMASLWREGFSNFCNGLGREMGISFKDKLGPINSQRREAMCGCAGNRIRQMSDAEFSRFLPKSAEEVSTVYSAPDRRLDPGSFSLSGVFATCGATTMTDAFGFSAGKPPR